MATYRLSEEGRDRILQRMLQRVAPTTILVFGMLHGVVWYFFYREDAAIELSTIALYIVLYLALGTFSYFRSRKRQLNILRSFKVNIDEEGLERKQAGAPVLKIAREKVQKIEKQPLGGWIVFSPDRLKFIMIPEGVENPEQLQLELEAIKAVEPGKGSWTQKVNWMWVFVAFAISLPLFLTEIPFLFIPISVLAVVFWMYSLMVNSQVPHLGKGLRASLLIFKILALGAVLFQIWRIAG